MRKLLLWALVSLAPFNGMRVVCVEPAANPPASTEAETTHDEADCERICARYRPADNGENCLLTSTDGSCVVVLAGIARVPSHDPILLSCTSHSCLEAPNFYVEPGLGHRNPPPKG